MPEKQDNDKKGSNGDDGCGGRPPHEVAAAGDIATKKLEATALHFLVVRKSNVDDKKGAHAKEQALQEEDVDEDLLVGIGEISKPKWQADSEAEQHRHDDDYDFDMDPSPLTNLALPVPTLRRTEARRREESAPGAFAVQPTNMTTGEDTLVPAAFEDQPESDAGPQTARQGDLNADPLPAVEATLSPNQEGVGGLNENQANTPPPSTSRDEEDGLASGSGVILVEASPDPDKTRYCGRKLLLAIVLILLVAVVLLSLGLAGGLSANGNTEGNDNEESDLLHEESMVNDNSSSVPYYPPDFYYDRLNYIKKRGYMQCSYKFIPGLLEKDSATGEVFGEGATHCKALAAAIWSPEELDERLYYVDNPHLGVQIVEGPRILGDFEPLSLLPYPNRGLIFTTTTHFNPIKLAGDPFYVECAEEKDFKHIEECQDMRVCVIEGQPHHDFILTRINARFVVPFNDPMKMILSFAHGQCNLVFTIDNLVPIELIQLLGYRGNYTTGNTIYERGAWSSFVDNIDQTWYDFVNVVTNAPMIAEQRNITKATAHLMPQTLVFGEEHKDMLRNVVAAVGNLAEQYEASGKARSEMNRLNNGTTGLIYSHPMKDERGEFPTYTHYHNFSEDFRQVMNRGHLVCGIRFGRPGFAMGTPQNATGFEVDLCRGIAAGLSVGDPDAVVFVALEDQDEGYQKLVDGEIDVYAGGVWNLDNDVKEKTTGKGFVFSQPYFYGYSPEEDNLCLVTMQHPIRRDLALFVYWTINALIYAEERGITQFDFLQMPTSPVMFGQRFERWFGDSVLGVGNFGELYDRNLEEVIPRSGRNQLSPLSNPGALHYPMPFPLQ